MDDWSLLPSRNAVSEPAPNPQGTMSTTTLLVRLTRPRQAPPTDADQPRPRNTALDPHGLARQQDSQSGAKPRNPGAHRHPPSRTRPVTSTTRNDSLDNTRPFMDDTGRLSTFWAARTREWVGDQVLLRCCARKRANPIAPRAPRAQTESVGPAGRRDRHSPRFAVGCDGWRIACRPRVCRRPAIWWDNRYGWGRMVRRTEAGSG
jgi:hypothetical protein